MQSNLSDNIVLIANESVNICGNTTANQIVSNKSISIGYCKSPGPYSINVGYNTNQISPSSITIGTQTQTQTSVPNNCINISAAATTTSGLYQGSCQINPIRTATGSYALYYNPSTFEITYGNEMKGPSTQTLSTPGAVDVSGMYSTTNLATPGVFTISNGSTNFQTKSIYNTSGSGGGSGNDTWGYVCTLGRSTGGFEVNAIAFDKKRNVLYIGGNFNLVNGITNNNIARYDLNTQTWFSMGSGLDQYALAFLIDVNNDILYVGGSFLTVDGVTNNRIARYNLTTNKWDSPMGEGSNGIVNALAVDQQRQFLFVGGSFSRAGGVPNLNNIVRYDITTAAWSSLNSGVNNTVYALIVYGSKLFVSGNFTQANGITANYIAQYDSSTSSWSAVGSGLNTYGRTFAIDSSRNILYIGGNFSQANGKTVNYIVAYNMTTSTWASLGTGVNGYVRGITIDSNFTTLYVGGQFLTADGSTVNQIARYSITNNAWGATMGTGLPSFSEYVDKVCLDDAHNTLYVGGYFSSINGTPYTSIAKYNYISTVKTTLTGLFKYKYTNYTSIDMGTNASINCFYCSSLSSWVITAMTDVAKFT